MDLNVEVWDLLETLEYFLLLAFNLLFFLCI
jgi:hypothetical protein